MPIADVEWIVGFTGSDSAGHKGPFTATRTIELNGVTTTISQAFTVDIGTWVDTVNVSAGNVVTVALGLAGFVDVQALAASGSSDGSSPYHTTLSASFLLHRAPHALQEGASASVPEPGVLGALALGFVAALGMKLRRRA